MKRKTLVYLQQQGAVHRILTENSMDNSALNLVERVNVDNYHGMTVCR